MFLQGTDGEPGEKGEDGEAGQPVSTCQINEVLDIDCLITNDCSCIFKPSFLFVYIIFEFIKTTPQEKL